LHLECEVFLQILNDHDQKRKLDAERAILLRRAGYVVGRNIGTDDFQDGRLDIVVGDSFDMSVANFLVPDLKRLTPDTVEYREKPRLESIPEHFG